MLLFIPALLFLTPFAQIPEAVNARFVAVAPTKRESIATDYRDVFNREIIRDGFRFQDSLPRPLVDALGARAGAAKFRRSVETNAPVGPGDTESGITFLHNLTRLDTRPASFHHVIHQGAFEQSVFNECQTEITARSSDMLAHGLLDRARRYIVMGS